MFGLRSTGSFSNMEQFLSRIQSDMTRDLERFGQEGVDALANATPVDSGLTQASWRYVVIRERGKFGIEWHNTNVNDGSQVAILIQYGHGTGTGGYIPGRDYINPAIRPVFDRIANDIWRKVRG